MISISSAAVIFLYPTGVTSLLKIFFLFSLVFFGIVPVVELHYGRIYWGGGGFESGAYLYAGIIILVLNVMVLSTYILVNRDKVYFSEVVLAPRDIELSMAKKIILLALCFLCLLFVLHYNNYNFQSLVFRGGEFVERSRFDSKSANLIYGSVIRFIPLSSAIVLLFMVRGSRLLKALLLVVGLICAFPTALARLQVPTYYFPILLYLFPSMIRGNRLVIVLLMGFIFVFPFLENFRNYSGDKEFILSIDYQFLLSGHMDAFQNFARMVSIDFVTYGAQLLGVLLFFVPRSIWPDKPVGTGYQMAENIGYSFNNVSATWYAEGWANFGLMGAMMFAVSIGYLMAKLDKMFWIRRNRFFSVIYLYLLGYMFFIMRGDLLSAFSYLVGTMVALAIPFWIVYTKRLS